MLHHVSVGVRDLERATNFYDTVLGTLGYNRVMEVLPVAVAYGVDEPSFWVQLPHNQQMATAGNGTHISLIARSQDAVDAFYAAAMELGAQNAGEPGPRPDYAPDYYCAFIYDLDGNKLEAALKALPPPPKKPARKVTKKITKKKVSAKAAPAPKTAKKAVKKAKKKVIKVIAVSKPSKAKPSKNKKEKPIKKDKKDKKDKKGKKNKKAKS